MWKCTIIQETVSIPIFRDKNSCFQRINVISVMLISFNIDDNYLRSYVLHLNLRPPFLLSIWCIIRGGNRTRKSATVLPTEAIPIPSCHDVGVTVLLMARGSFNIELSKY